MAPAQPAGLPLGVEAFARPAEPLEDLPHAVVAPHRPAGRDPAFDRAAVSNQPHCHAHHQLLDSSPLLLVGLLPDDEPGVPTPEELLLESPDEPDELLDRPDELAALPLDELLGGGGGGGGGDEPLDEEPESLDEDAPGLLDDPLEPEALVPELLDEDGPPPEELLSGPDDDELLCPLLLEPLLELEELPKALDEGPLLDGTPLDDELDELPLAELLDELPEEPLDDRPLLEDLPDDDEISPLEDELRLEDELLELGEPPPEELDEPLDDDDDLLPDELLELDEPLLDELLEEPPEEDDGPDELPLEELLPDDEPDEEPDELPDEPLLDDDPEEPLDEDELELPLDELLEDGGQTV